MFWCDIRHSFLADITSSLMDKNHIQIHPWYNLYIYTDLLSLLLLFIGYHNYRWWFDISNIKNDLGISRPRELSEWVSNINRSFLNLKIYKFNFGTLEKFDFFWKKINFWIYFKTIQHIHYRWYHTLIVHHFH